MLRKIERNRIIPGTWRKCRAQGGVAKFLDRIKAANAAKNRKGTEQK